MKINQWPGLPFALVAMAILTPNAWAKKQTPAAPPVPLSETGQKLEAEYAKQLDALKEELIKSLPSLSGNNKSAYLKSQQAQIEAKAALDAAIKGQGELKRADALVQHAKGKWIGGSDKAIAKAQQMLKAAKTDAERAAAHKDLDSAQKGREAGVAALKERQAAYDKALKNKAAMEKQLVVSEKALAQAKKDSLNQIKKLGLNSFLASDKLDGKLAKFAVLKEATPRGLATFSQKGAAQHKLLDQLLSDEELLIQMAVADGASNAKYGRAMEIYQAIQKASDKAAKGNLQRLALAVSLEHATPIKQRNAVGKTDAPSEVDPVNRYLHYEKAFLSGELDPAFKTFSVYDYRMVVDGEEPDEILAWGREMLRNYRPDHVTMDDYRWRYAALVRSDIPYGSQDNQYDRDDLQFFQNILMNGGICGRRAFIGRFILRAFGVPTTARPQPGHAALAHWTPDGWVICLGAGWGAGTTKTRYKKDLEFLANVQARSTGEPFMQVKRAQWAGDVVGEKPVYGHLSGDPGFWYGVSLNMQRAIIKAANAKTLAAVGEDIGEATVTKEKIDIIDVKLSDEDQKISVDSKGVIKIPAVASSNPTKSSGKIIFMPCVLGGKQLHYSLNGGAKDFEYTFDAPKAGEYELTAKVVTPSWKQNLMVTANGKKEPVKIALPHTVGLWEVTAPVVVELKKGKNVLSFAHQTDVNPKGFSIKEFTLTPR